MHYLEVTWVGQRKSVIWAFKGQKSATTAEKASTVRRGRSTLTVIDR